MHHHFTDMFNGLDLGVAERVMFVDGVSTSAPVTPTPQSSGAEPENAPPVEPAPKPEPPKVEEGPNGPRDAVGGAQNLEAGKPGALPAPAPNTPELKSEVEKAVDDGKISDEEKQPLADGSRSEVLADVKQDAEGWLNDAGRKEVHADNLERVANQNQDAAKADLDEAGKLQPPLSENEMTRFSERVAVAEKAENEIVETVKNRQKLVGVNEAEIAQLDATRSPNAANWKNQDTEVYKNAEELTTKFQEAGGQVYEPDMFGDDWDTEKDWNFEQVAKKYADDPERWKNDFVNAQGDGEKVVDAQRRSTAEALLVELENYTAAQEENKVVDDKIGDRRESIDKLTEQIGTDIKDLSKDRRAGLSGPGIDPKPADAPEEQPADKPAGTTPAGEQPKPEEVKSGEHQANAPGDLAKPENREQLLQKGVEAGVIPQNVGFNDQGQAVYTVQEGDSYWSITERLNNNTFDPQIWNSTMQSNAQLLDRTGSPDIINPGDQIVVPYFTQQRYAEMLPK